MLAHSLPQTHYLTAPPLQDQQTTVSTSSFANPVRPSPLIVWLLIFVLPFAFISNEENGQN
jgi:hypothetical protein